MASPIKFEIVAEIELSAAEDGGRITSIASGVYRGVLGVGADNFSARLFIPMSDPRSPGDLSAQFGIQFLYPEAALPYFPVGATFTVWEGRVIGTGRVLSVLTQR